MSFEIDLIALKEDVNVFHYTLTDAYFEAIDAPAVRKGQLECELAITKVGGSYELVFNIKGEVQVTCDRCLDDMPQAIDTENKLIVKFGEEWSEEDDILTIPEDEGKIDVSWYMYEFIVLDIPMQHTHAPGKCDIAMVKLLEEYESCTDDTNQQEVDPRWSKLAELLDKN